MSKYNKLLNFRKENTPVDTTVVKNLEQLKQVQANISKREKIIQDMNVPYHILIK